jgi:hypothetical protein
MLGLTRDTVRDRLHRLEAANLILIRRRWAKSGDTRSHHCILLEPAPLPPCNPAAQGEEDGMGDAVAGGDGIAYPLGDAVARGVSDAAKKAARPAKGNYPLSPEGVIAPMQGETGRSRRPPPGDAAADPRRPDRHEQESINNVDVNKKRKEEEENVDVVNANSVEDQHQDNNILLDQEYNNISAMDPEEFADWAVRCFQARLGSSVSAGARARLKDAARCLHQWGAPEWWQMALDAAAASGQPNAAGVHHAVATAIATNSPPKRWARRSDSVPSCVGHVDAVLVGQQIALLGHARSSAAGCR